MTQTEHLENIFRMTSTLQPCRSAAGQTFGITTKFYKISIFRQLSSLFQTKHSDSLDTLLYVRFAIQNLEFYEWKLGDHG